MKHWYVLEQHMNKRYRKDGELSFRLKAAEYTLVIFGICEFATRWDSKKNSREFVAVEYLIALSSNIYNQYCIRRLQGFEGYMRAHFDYWFDRIQYNDLFAIILFVRKYSERIRNKNNFSRNYFKINNTMCNVIWNYLDLFIITVSICLTSKFREFNNKLQELKHKSDNFVNLLQKKNISSSYINFRLKIP